jgi:5-methyltetrahydropteroyltriglutamate--homocysteine methyltransferase
MALAANLGFPRMGARRELKTALESFWAGKLDEKGLLDAARSLRSQNWHLQKAAGLDHIPSNDFSFYDQVLDTAVLSGAVPARYGWSGVSVDLSTYFAMARGRQGGRSGGDVPAMEMTKWFDTNYHFIVPEFSAGQKFFRASSKPVDSFQEAKALGVNTRPVLVGPVSFLLLGKPKADNLNPLALLESLLPVYEETLKQLASAGAEWVQMDEPCLVLDLADDARAAFGRAYTRLAKAAPSLKILVATYFGDLRGNLDAALGLPVAALHLDLVRAPEQLERALKKVPAGLSLSLGLVDGRNIWRADLEKAVAAAEKAAAALGGDRLQIAPSCSLLHSPVDLDIEDALDPELRQWLAFAKQKVEEVAVVARAVNQGRAAVQDVLKANAEAVARRRTSPKIHNQAVQKRLAAASADMLSRKNPFPARKKKQQARLSLPLFPTTTIGSFPQTPEIRAARAAFKAGKSDQKQYDEFLKEEIKRVVAFQEEVGLDVLVHGEPERNDMVEYFGERLAGFAFTKNGWVQSYGSRCVKPPVIFGDVSRPSPMTVDWSRHAQSLTQKPMKGMLTGPVTILQWSFVRDDQPRETTCRQIALAIRDEVADLEKAGIGVIQIDEPALREGLPLRRDDWKAYLKWAVESFRLSAAGAADETQIHTHMCYSEFNDIIEAIGELDADVISVEASRSQMELLGAFKTYRYPNDIGPGVYDIHSPRVPSQKEMEDLLEKALEVLSPDQLWVNPDCGLKTRRWEEVRPSLAAMTAAARGLRARHGAVSGKA